MKQFFYGLLFCCLLFSACTDEPPIEPSGIYSEGVFTINEGIFGQTSGTITHYNRTDGTVAQKIFKQANSRDLGDVVQSMSFYEDKAYIVVNNSNKIEIADANTFEEKAQITGLRLPRYFLTNRPNRAYVSEWGGDGLTGTIAVLDLNTQTILRRISVGVGPERLLPKDGKLYVTHVGGYASNNIISVIDTTTDQVQITIPVLDKPSACVEAMDGSIWVACAGEIAYLTYPAIDTANSTESGLVQIDPITNAVVQTISFGKGNPVGNLILNTNNKSELYYSRSGKVWKYDLITGVEETLFSGDFYGLGFDLNTNYIYAATSTGVNAAEAQRYDTNGNLIDRYGLGVFANGFVFR
jgi:YVTN family beta-propeller protein